jgi:hypothetical protein
MTPTQIHQAIRSRIAEADIMPIAFPNVEQNTDGDYADVNFILPVWSDDTINGQASYMTETVQIDTVTSLDDGIDTAEAHSLLFANLFPLGLRLDFGTWRLEVNKSAQFKSGFLANTKWRTPLLISYKAIKN